MIEIIDNVAYLKDIKTIVQAEEMLDWLKSNPAQKLYLIEGINKYGCSVNGELIKLENMPAESVENGYCINPFWFVEPLIEATFDETIPINEIPVDMITKPDDTSDALMEKDNRISELEKEIEYCNNECDSRELIIKEMRADNKLYLEKIVQLENENRALFNDLNEAQLANSTKVDGTNIIELCQALKNLGFETRLTYL